MTPTESAHSEFKRGTLKVIEASGQSVVIPGLMPIFVSLFSGLDQMATAQRAIYLKLEEIEKELKGVSRQTGGIRYSGLTAR
jgi:hypothetical protein